MAPRRSRASQHRRGLAIATVSALLAAATAYGVGLAVEHSPASAGPELVPRVVRPTTSPTTAATPDVAVATPTPDRPTPDGAASPTATPVVPLATPAPPVLPTVVLRPADRGEPVRELQTRLFQLEWLPEVTTGVYDATTEEAVQGFQVRRGLKATGVLDRTSWRRLVAMTHKPSHDAM